MKPVSLPDIDSDICINMFNSHALKLAGPFLQHESKVLERLFHDSQEINNIVVIGSGPLAYGDLAISRGVRYFGIDPFYHASHKSPLINLINDKFENLERQKISEGKTIFVFWFNVAFYINDLFETINRLIKKGDIVFFSSWGSGTKTKILIKKYLKEVYKVGEKHSIIINSRCDEIAQFSLADNLLRRIDGVYKIDSFSNGINDVKIIFTEKNTNN